MLNTTYVVNQVAVFIIATIAFIVAETWHDALKQFYQTDTMTDASRFKFASALTVGLLALTFVWVIVMKSAFNVNFTQSFAKEQVK